MSAPVLRDHDFSGYGALLDLWQESWQVVLPEIDFPGRRPWFSDYLKGLVAGGVRLREAIDGQGRIAGFCTLDPATGYLDQLAVRRDLWGAGIAAALIADARTFAPGQIELKVNQANTRAIAFYEKQGFARIRADVSTTSGLPLWVYRWTA